MIKKRKEGNSGVTGQSFRLTGQGFRSYWKNGRFIPEKVSGLNRNECPDNPGIGVRTTPEYADGDGNRLPHLEKQIDVVFKAKGKNSAHEVDLHKIEAVLERELHHRNIVKPEQSYSAKLIGLACG